MTYRRFPPKVGCFGWTIAALCAGLAAIAIIRIIW
jgi:hypothetical protein